ncbi:MAG: YciI family protein [Actinomycetia bacterium]|nr:YciI family protein [Actinomycetes bacterium]
MTNYVLAYTGGGMPEGEAAVAAEMAAWGEWYRGMGAQLVDGGNPFGASKTVTSDGVSDSGTSQLTGYTVVSTSDLDAAAEIAAGCPTLQRGGSVEVYETFQMPR